MKIGNQIRQLRSEQQLSLEELAALTGVSRSMLSAIERDAKSPTLRTLTQIASGLGVNLGALLGEAASEPVIVYRQSDRNIERDPATGLEFEALAPDWRAEGLGVLLLRLPSGKSTGVLSPHPLNTRELIYVMDGSALATIDGTDVPLGPGDSISFTAKESHELRAVSAEECQLLILTKGPRPEFLG